MLVIGIGMSVAWCGEAAALDQQDLSRLMADNACESCDLAGAQFARMRISGSDLVGSSLNGADLSGSVLFNVDLSNADLRDADFSGAVIQATQFSGADLAGATLAGTVFVGADLSGAQGLSQQALSVACDDQRANVSQVPIPFALPPCQ
jgi:uncharacterized protein YjbI with pentapeptide repeats